MQFISVIGSYHLFGKEYSCLWWQIIKPDRREYVLRRILNEFMEKESETTENAQAAYWSVRCNVRVRSCM
jgi:hypothetical protein